MKKRLMAVVAVLMLLSALALSLNGAEADVRTVPLEDTSIIVEVNSTDGDAGLQLFLDGEAWRSIQVRSPDGRKIGFVVRDERGPRSGRWNRMAETRGSCYPAS